MNISLSPFAPKSLVSRDGKRRPFRDNLLILHTQAESGACSRGSSRFLRRHLFIFLNCHTASDQSRVYQVTHLRVDSVHCRESAGIGPFLLKVVSVPAAAFAGVWVLGRDLKLTREHLAVAPCRRLTQFLLSLTSKHTGIARRQFITRSV